VIRRGFWLTAGAVAGIIGYRRVSAVGRRVSGRLSRGQAPRQRLAGQAIRFARDVREGMDLYMARHSPPEGPTLGARDLPTARGRSRLTNHDTRPKDGH
jgi:hypothetical protein